MSEPFQPTRPLPNNWLDLERYARELEARITDLEKRPCPYVIVADEGTASCTLAESAGQQFRARLEAAERERDAARAEAARLREVLAEISAHYIQSRDGKPELISAYLVPRASEMRPDQRARWKTWTLWDAALAALAASETPAICECVECCDGEHLGECKECAGHGDRMTEELSGPCEYCGAGPSWLPTLKSRGCDDAD